MTLVVKASAVIQRVPKQTQSQSHIYGRQLAQHVLSRSDVDWGTLQIDVCGVDPISSFFSGFYGEIAARSPEVLPLARRLHWITKFPFQAENARRIAEEFKTEDERLNLSPELRTAIQQDVLDNYSHLLNQPNSKVWLEPTTGSPIRLLQAIALYLIKHTFEEFNFCVCESDGGNLAVAAKARAGNRIEFFNVVFN